MDLIERARKLLQSCEPSVSGSNGHNKLLAAACALVNGFAFDDALAERLLLEEFNPRCSPPWSERDVKRKVQQAHKFNSEPRGHLIGAGNHKTGNYSSPAQSYAQQPERLKKRQDFDGQALKAMMLRGFRPSFKWLAELSPIDPRKVTPWEYLDAILEPGEKTLIFYEFTSQGEFGHVAGAPGTLYRAGSRPGQKPEVVESYPDSGRVGAWYLPNPLDGKWWPSDRVDKAGNAILSRRMGRSVTSWRYLLLESDDADPDDWLNLLCQLPLPVTALYTSGDRSIHALIRIEAQSKGAFDAFRDRYMPILSRLGADPGAITGVRLTRLPGVLRQGKDKGGKYIKFPKPVLQRLLFLNPNPEVKPLKHLPRLRIITENTDRA
ncbi:MAG: hypothetical protein QM680_12175 [Luteolibacter sp.]